MGQSDPLSRFFITSARPEGINDFLFPNFALESDLGTIATQKHASASRGPALLTSKHYSR